MSFDWAHYFDLAQELHADAGASALEEAKLRAAISRAYYAAFCLARNYLLTNHPHISIPSDGTAHTIVKDMFENDGDLIWRSIGIKLGRLRRQRGFADYDDTIANPASQAQLSVIVAGEAITKIKSLL